MVEDTKGKEDIAIAIATVTKRRAWTVGTIGTAAAAAAAAGIAAVARRRREREYC